MHEKKLSHNKLFSNVHVHIVSGISNSELQHD